MYTIEFIEQITPRQNCFIDYTLKYCYINKNNKKIINNDFFYAHDDFEGKHVKIKFDRNTIFNRLEFGSEKNGFKEIIENAIHKKMREVDDIPYGELNHYDVISKKIDDEGTAIIIIKIIDFSPDVG